MKTEILNHFRNVDEKLFLVAQKYPNIEDIKPLSPDKYFTSLTRNIVYQQLSGKAGDAIWSRVIALTNNSHSPENILKLTHEELRNSGLSNSKASYIKNIAEAFENQIIDIERISELENEEIIEKLTQIKGIGRWTAEIFLMFTVGREDIFPLGDLGLKKGFRKLYDMKNDPKPKYLISRTKKWSPFRTYAALLLWAHLDNRS